MGLRGRALHGGYRMARGMAGIYGGAGRVEAGAQRNFERPVGWGSTPPYARRGRAGPNRPGARGGAGAVIRGARVLRGVALPGPFANRAGRNSTVMTPSRRLYRGPGRGMGFGTTCDRPARGRPCRAHNVPAAAVQPMRRGRRRLRQAEHEGGRPFIGWPFIGRPFIGRPGRWRGPHPRVRRRRSLSPRGRAGRLRGPSPAPSAW